MKRKETGVTYLLAILPALFFIHGIHRFYLGKPISAIFYLITLGWLGIGTIVDLFLIPSSVRKINEHRMAA